MNIAQITIHNFRSINEVTVSLQDYSMIVGENNVGKTNIVTALRIFYEDGGIKFRESIDFPKFPTSDRESWVEIVYNLTSEENDFLKDEYKNVDGTLRVRRYFLSENTDLVRANQSNIYGYVNGELSTNLFYGARNVSQAKLGSVIYIPAISKTDDTLKLSGPSPFRDIIDFVMKRAVVESQTFQSLEEAFEIFNTEFREESSKDGFSINSLIEEVNESIANWKIEFGFTINTIKPEDIIKNLLSSYIEDINLGKEQVNINSLGQGLQRHLIYTLLKLSSKYKSHSSIKKKDFNPDFILILFEEPEAFLHPSQQENLHFSLRSLSSENKEQIIITSHSPHFVSKAISEIHRIIRLNKNGPITHVHQILKESLGEILEDNLGLYQKFCDEIRKPDCTPELKNNILKKELGDENPDQSNRLELEAVRYYFWLNVERAAMFFAKHVIICEGPSEKVFLDYLFDEIWIEYRDKHVYCLDSMGKFNIHRCMRMLTALGIHHSVLMDGDGDTDIHAIINNHIDERCTDLTYKKYVFPQELEDFLEIDKPKRTDLKPLNLIIKYKRGEICSSKLNELKDIIDTLIP